MKTYPLLFFIVMLTKAQTDIPDNENQKLPAITNQEDSFKPLGVAKLINNEKFNDTLRRKNMVLFKIPLQLSQIKLSNIQSIAKDLKKFLLKDIIDIPNKACKLQMISIQKEVSSGSVNEWILPLIDATFKLNSGILEGNTGSYGSPHECLQLSANLTESETIKGKYCIINGVLTDFQFMKNGRNLERFLGFAPTTEEVALLMGHKTFGGICIPSACTADLLQPIFNTTMDYLNGVANAKFGQNLPIRIKSNERSCYDGSPKPLSTMNIVSISVLVLLLGVLIWCTFYDMLKNEDSFPSVIKCFSLRENSKKLFSTKTTDSSLTCLNGLRVLSMCTIFYGHEVLIMRISPLTNNIDSFHYGDSTVVGFLGFFAVETFFAISGMLSVYLFFISKMPKSYTAYLINTYITRYTRLVPVLGLTILIILNSSLLCNYNLPTYCTSYFLMEKLEHCESNWWLTLLFLQNYINSEKMCVRPSWYLAVDTHLFMLLPILLYGLKYFRKSSIFVSVLLIGVVSAINGILTHAWNLMPVMPINKSTSDVYQATHLRFFSWLIGALFGYVIAYCKKKNKTLPRVLIAILWIFSLGVVLGTVVYIRERIIKDDINTVEASLINALLRQIWSVSISTMVLLCSMGSGGFINKILSSPVFTVSSRLTYTMYLMHVYVMVYYRFGRMTLDYFNDWEIVHHFLANLMATLLLSIVSTLAVEMPFASLGKVLLLRGTKKEEKTATLRENDKSLSEGIHGNIIPIFIRNIDTDLPQ